MVAVAAEEEAAVPEPDLGFHLLKPGLCGQYKVSLFSEYISVMNCMLTLRLPSSYLSGAQAVVSRFQED